MLRCRLESVALTSTVYKWKDESTLCKVKLYLLFYMGVKLCLLDQENTD
jgi:hypothetical protein